MGAIIPRTVIILGIASLLTDLSSEMIYPLLPAFIATTLGGGPLALGVIEGAAEATASVLKALSGWWSDRISRRKPLIVGGYALAGLVRPLVGLAGSWPVVLFIRVTDRIGKGIRTAPRDALIADATPLETRGRAYGFHRAMDHAGAVGGPLIAAALLSIEGVSVRTVFLLAAVPGILTLLVLVLGVREEKKTISSPPEPLHWSALDPGLKPLLGAVFLFTLGNSSDAFLLMRLSERGLSPGGLALLWSAFHVVKMTSSALGGRWVDRFGPKPLILLGWLVYALAYLGLGAFESREILVGVFLFYGLAFGLSEPAEKALVSRLASPSGKGTAFGVFHLVTGLGALPASLLFGWIWKTQGHLAAFGFGALLAALASAVLFSRVRVPRD